MVALVEGVAAVLMGGAGAEVRAAARERVGRARGRTVLSCMVVDALLSCYLFRDTT